VTNGVPSGITPCACNNVSFPAPVSDSSPLPQPEKSGHSAAQLLCHIPQTIAVQAALTDKMRRLEK